jgi:hypothetical protein
MHRLCEEHAVKFAQNLNCNCTYETVERYFDQIPDDVRLGFTDPHSGNVTLTKMAWVRHVNDVLRARFGEEEAKDRRLSEAKSALRKEFSETEAEAILEAIEIMGGRDEY